MRVGEIDVVPIEDGVALISINEPFIGMPPEAWKGHERFLTANGELELVLGGFLIRSGDRLALVDTGIGPRTGMFTGGKLLENLARVGVSPSDITDVVFTHLHFDHVGWATQQGRIVFDHATYRCDARDWDHFVGSDEGATRKLIPLVDRMEFWSGSGPLLPGVDAMVAPGHTPGSTIMVISSGTQRALLIGDVAHCPLELSEEEWSGLGDVDVELARRTRNALARELEGTDIPVAAAHFPGMQFGRIIPGEGKRQWVVP
jgi:glyoxylase-like metal-dependent hydrolase (beta-lactamase superfamily II)